MIGVCTDSNAQLPLELVRAHGIEVVPLSIEVDGVSYLEGVELDADAFYAFFDDGRQPVVATSAPGPGRFAAAYKRLADRGATAVLSVHVGAETSGTLNAAAVAAAEAPVPVRLVDTGSASFVVACAALAAAAAVAGGAIADQASAVARGVAERCGNVFVLGALDLARRGGRLDPAVSGEGGVPVLSLVGGRMREAGRVRDVEAAAQSMADAVLAGARHLRVGVGVADEASRPVAEELTRRLRGHPAVAELISYRIGPSVGAHTGPGTAGAVYHELD